MEGVNTPSPAEENLHQTSTYQGKYRLIYQFSSALGMECLAMSHLDVSMPDQL